MSANRPANDSELSSDRTGSLSQMQLAVGLAATTLPDETAFLTAANQAILTLLINQETPVGTTLNVQSSATGADLPNAVNGDLNVAVITAPLVDSKVTIPSGYLFSIATGGNATLISSGGNADTPGHVLVGDTSTASLTLNGTGTIIGGNGSDTMVTSNGLGYVYGGTGQNLISMTTRSVVFSQGNDTVTADQYGYSQNSTVNASGSLLYLDEGGYPENVVSTGSSTLVGFAGTLSGGGSALVFDTGATSIQGGSGSSTIIGGGITTLTGGTASDLIFGGSGANLHIAEGTGVDTIVGAGSNFVTVGSAGALIFGAGNNGYADTILSTAGGPLTDIEYGSAFVSLGGAANNLIGISSGIIDASTSTGSNTIFDNGSASISGGSGPLAVVVSNANSTLNAGSGLTLFLIPAQAQTSRQFVITNFDGAHDFIDLVGYASSAPAAAFKSEVTTNTAFGPAVTATLLDGTKIVFQTPANLASFSYQ